MKNFWNGLHPQAKAGLAAGVLAIVALTAAAAWWLLRTDYAVLFSDLKPQDAAVMATELEKLKVPYTVGDGGTTLLVDRAQVHTTRLKLMGRELPLNGAVGFELFNTTDFGMTEFAQKINYQRALQGELTRTILSFPEVRDARVHLALPEQGLFKQATSRPKAAVTLTMRQGQALRAEQVNGIQRLLAASVPGLAAQEVTIVDQQGVALSRVAGDAEGETAGAGGRLDLKRETENHLSRKAGAVLERAFGPGQALASVDVTLNMDQVRVTTEDVIAAPGARGGAPTGVLVRERESTRDSSTPDPRPGDTRAAQGASSTQREVEYQTGRRVEQVVSQPGSIRRLQVVAIVRRELSAQQEEQVRRLVAAAVGFSAERGDTVVVQALGAQPSTHAVPAQGPTAETPAVPTGTATQVSSASWTSPLLIALAVLVLAGAALGILVLRKPAHATQPRMTPAEREAALARVKAWMRQDESPAAGAGR